jgi:hypothetical protein
MGVKPLAVIILPELRQKAERGFLYHDVKFSLYEAQR